MLDSMTGQYCDGETDDTKKDQDVEGYANKTCKKALSVFYATCKEKGLDYTKPMPKKAEEGKFTFLVDSLIITEGVAEGVYKAHGFALHPIITHHPGEPPRVYSAVKEELIKAAPTLKGKHLDIDHSDVAVNPSVNVITDAKWNTEVEAVEFWAQIDDYLYELIQGGCPVSVSIDWLIPDQGGIKVVEVDGEIGIAPYGFEFGDPGLSILQNMTPGDPNAMIELLMESVSRASINRNKKMKKKLKEQQEPVQPIVAGEYVLGFYQDVCLFLPEHFRTVWLDKENGILAVFGKLSAEPETERVQSIFFAKEKMWDQTKIQDWLSIHPDYMAPAGDSAVSKAPLIERGNMKKKPKIKEQNGGEPKTDKERFMAHFGIDADAFQKLYDILGDELFKLLPERGQKINEQNGQGNNGNDGQNLTVDQIKAKIADLSKKNADIMAQLYPEAELTDEQRATLNAESETIWAEINALETALAAAITAQVGVTLGEGYKVVLEVKLKEAEWDAEYINNLPDSSFAFIEEGGEKDEDGKTKPRSLRHLPFKDAEGNINKAHLNNALGRLAQTDLSDGAKAAAKKKLCAAVKTWNGAHSDDQITSDVCGVEPSGQGSSNKEGLLEAKVTELLARVGKLEKAHGGAQGNLSESLLKNSKEPTIKVTDAIKTLEGLLLSPMLERSSMMEQRHHQDIRKAIFKYKEMLKSG